MDKPADRNRIATSICRTVAEIPDRSSPDDWPEAMLVTADELHTIVVCALETEAEAVTEGRRDNRPNNPDRWQIDDQGRVYSRPDPLTKYVIAQMESGSPEHENLVLAAPDMLAALHSASWLLADISPDGLVKKQIDEVIARATPETTP